MLLRGRLDSLGAIGADALPQFGEAAGLACTSAGGAPCADARRASGSNTLLTRPWTAAALRAERGERLRDGMVVAIALHGPQRLCSCLPPPELRVRARVAERARSGNSAARRVF